MPAVGWIKSETALEGDPRVKRMARILAPDNQERGITLALGGLTRLWYLADKYIGDDDVLPFGIDEINEVIGVQDFCSLIPVNWLEVIDATHVKLPEYQVHNGPTAKARAQGAVRASRYRHAVALRDADNRHASPLPDKSRLDKIKDKEKASPKRSRGTRIDEWRPSPDDVEFCSELKLHSDATYAKFRDYWIAKPGQAGVKLDWPATWRNWCRSEHARTGGTNGTGSPAVRDAAAWAETIADALACNYRPPVTGESLGAYKTAVAHHKAAPSTTPLALRQGLAGLRAKLTGAP